ncbi:MAG: type I glutamate--ammonia ligase [Acidimicrobiales bacterium]|nr:type I glutamate--ammonia ligase [Acidimicrobiales bacterium]
MDRQMEYVLRTVEERGVRFVRLWFTDVLGQLKSFAISPAELESAFEEGMQFDGSAIDGFSRIQESDVLARPDASTFEILPWDGKDAASARMFCDLTTLDNSPFAGDPRQVLRRNLHAARDLGYSFFVAPEIEFFYFESADPSQPPRPLDSGSYFDLTTADVASDLRRRTIQHLESMGIPVEYSFHEDSPSQHEIDLRYTDALSMADNVMTLRLVVRETAMEQGVHATFMPKPMAGVQGSGMHTHLSLFQDEQNAFHDPDQPYLLSKTGQAFVAGLLRHAAEITAVTNQLVNSYKRLIIGTEAPSQISWARNHRAALVRVPVTKAGKEDSVRIEYRSPDSACNPYLVYSLLLAAGLKGIAEGYDLPDEASSFFDRSPQERAKAGIDDLPQSLAEALDAMEGSDLVRETLGDHIFEWFLRNKRAEWSDYKAQVTPFELARYLPTW